MTNTTTIINDDYNAKYGKADYKHDNSDDDDDQVDIMYNYVDWETLLPATPTTNVNHYYSNDIHGFNIDNKKN